MNRKLHSTALRRNIGLVLSRLEEWGINPWRRYSLYLIIFFIGFFVGGSLGMINGAMSLMDPIGSFYTVLFLEVMIRFRRLLKVRSTSYIALNTLDMARLGLLYGLFLEGFKLL